MFQEGLPLVWVLTLEVQGKLPAGSHDGHLSKEPVQGGHLQVTCDRGEGEDDGHISSS